MAAMNDMKAMEDKINAVLAECGRLIVGDEACCPISEEMMIGRIGNTFFFQLTDGEILFTIFPTLEPECPRWGFAHSLLGLSSPPALVADENGLLEENKRMIQAFRDIWDRGLITLEELRAIIPPRAHAPIQAPSEDAVYAAIQAARARYDNDMGDDWIAFRDAMQEAIDGLLALAAYREGGEG